MVRRAPRSQKPDLKVAKLEIGRVMAVFETSAPKTMEAIHELAVALWSVAISEEHCRRIATELIRTSEFCPMPAKILAAAARVPSREMLPEGCERCGGTGWAADLSPIEAARPHALQESAGVRRCACALGRHLLRRERETRAAQA